MEATPQQQIVNLIKNKEKILLITHRKIDGDALGSTLALHKVLKEMGKDVTAVSSDPVPEMYNFIPDLEEIETTFHGNQDFIITLDCKNAEVDKLKYNLEDKKVNIIVSPMYGNFSAKDVSFAKGGDQFDLIIVLDSADLEQIGSIYEKNTDLFFSAPVINIDHHASNTFFGNINLVEITAASTSEVLLEIIQKLEKIENKEFINEDIATLLLLGIITDTSSFQNPNTTPKSFDIAADLIDLGARQQEIIQQIYKTKKLSTLKLWGQTLSKIQVDPVHRLVWSSITKNDLNESGANVDESEGIIDELMSNAPGAEVILLLKDNSNGILSGSLRTTSANIDASQIAQMFGGGGHLQAAGFKIPNGKDFDIQLAEILKKIKKFQTKRLGLPEHTDNSETKKSSHDLELTTGKIEKHSLETNNQEVEINSKQTISKESSQKSKSPDKTRQIEEKREKPKEKRVINISDKLSQASSSKRKIKNTKRSEEKEKVVKKNIIEKSEKVHIERKDSK